MKQINKYIKGIAGISLLAAMLFSCAKFDEFSSKKATISAPTVTVGVSNVLDSTVTVTATSNMKGFMSVYVLVGSDTNVYNKVDLLTNNIPDDNVVAFASGEVAASEAINVNFVALIQNTSYKILAVANNAEGNTSNVAEATFLTDDSYIPKLGDVSPAVSSDAQQAVDFDVTLTFDEPVKLVDASLVEFGYWDYVNEVMVVEAVTADLISVSGSNVSIKQPITPPTGKMVYLTVGDGAFTDLVGNEWGGVESGQDVDGNFGLYWRTEKDFAVIDTITPGLGTSVIDSNDFVVTVTFDREIVDIYNHSEDLQNSAGVVFTYFFTNGRITSIPVPDANITIDGSNTVLIEQPITPSPGDKVYLRIGEGAFRDVNYVPNKAFEMEIGDDDRWLVSYGRTIDVVIGDYVVTGTDFFSTNPVSYNVTIAQDAAKTNGVIITGFMGSTEEITATFDGDLSELSISMGQNLGPLKGDGKDCTLDDGSGTGEGSIDAFVEANGDMAFNFGTWNSDGWYLFIQGGTWTKQ